MSPSSGGGGNAIDTAAFFASLDTAFDPPAEYQLHMKAGGAMLISYPSFLALAYLQRWSKCPVTRFYQHTLGANLGPLQGHPLDGRF